VGFLAEKIMKVLIRQFLGKNHSWAICGWGIAQALQELGHEIHLFSTDGTVHLPSQLLPNLLGWTEENETELFGRMPDDNYDCQISYTCLKNFPHYLSSGTKNRFGIWVYEWAGKNVLPTGFAKAYKGCDVVCAPSHFGKQVFIDSGIPSSYIQVIPHGIHSQQYRGTSTLILPTTKNYKILSNIAQNHLRKNIPGLLAAYGEAFTQKDDVCLILKAKDKPIRLGFEVSLKECLNEFNRKYPNHAEVKVFSDFIPDISQLYRSVDTIFTMSFCEGFYFPALEGLAAGKLSIAPNWGGHLDFLDTSNSLLISGKETRADPKSMYWEAKNNAIWFQPDIKDAADKLRYAYHNFQKINEGVDKVRENVYAKFDWTVITSQFTELCK
jgi:glycosyltransferase involved in cell wall biosynthesis